MKNADRSNAGRELVFGLVLVLALLFACAAVSDASAQGDGIYPDSWLQQDPFSDLDLGSQDSAGGLDAQLGEVASLIASGGVERARSILLRLSEAVPEDARVWFLLGAAEHAMGHPEPAMGAVRNAIGLDGSWLAARWLEAEVYLSAGDVRKARASHAAAVLIDPENPLVYLRRVGFEVRFEGASGADLDGALRDVKAAERLGAPQISVAGLRGVILRQLGRYEEAERLLLDVLSMDEANPDALRQLVVLYDGLGRFADADALVGDSGVSAGLAGELWRARARSAVTSGAEDERVDMLMTRAVVENKADEGLVLEYARWLESRGRQAYARAVLDRWLTDGPASPAVMSQLAWALADLGIELDRANELVGRVRAFGREWKSSPYLADTAAWIQFQRGDLESALREIAVCEHLAVQIPEVAYHAAEVYSVSGDAERARRFLEMALARGTPFPGVEGAIELREQLEK